MTQICMASTLVGATTLAAAIDSGVLSAPTAGERILLVLNEALAPELVRPWYESPLAGPILSRFARVIFLNDALYPYLPTRWEPREEDVPMLERLFRSHWSLGNGPLELVVESLDTPPASALTQVFRQAPIDVLVAGLGGYGPSRPGLPLHVIQRIRELVHLDAVPGVTPVLLSEHGVGALRVSADAFKHVLAQMVAAAREADPVADYGDRPTSLILGQDLSGLDILSPDEEVALYVGMADAAVGRGAERVVFRPHPAALPVLAESLRQEAQRRGAEFGVVDPFLPAEVLVSAGVLDSVVSSFSTALVTVKDMFGVTTVSIGSETLLDRLTPYQAGSRIPLTIVDALSREGDPYGDPVRMQELIDTVSYCMQPRTVPHLRARAEAFLESLADPERRRYVKRARLEALKLPGGRGDGADAPIPAGATTPAWMRPAAAAGRRLRKFGAGPTAGQTH